MAEVKKQPNPIDVQVGARLRLRRTAVGMSQEKLGEHLGITFQQIQKYEKGTNRIGASRLQHICTVLGVPVSFFFPDTGPETPMVLGMAEPQSEFAHDFAPSMESSQLTGAFSQISDPEVRRCLLALVRALAAQTQNAKSPPRT